MISKIYRVTVFYEPKHGTDMEAIEDAVFSAIQAINHENSEFFSGNSAADPYITVEVDEKDSAINLEKIIIKTLEIFNVRIY